MQPPSKVVILDHDDGEESNDDELLELRLKALKTKLQRIDQEQQEKFKDEEEKLRIAALSSALFKKKEEIREKVKRKKQKDEQRPYSPSDQPLLMEDMILSPLGSPLVDCQEIDMDISDSNSPVMTAEKASSDMDIAESPQSIDDEDGLEIDEDEIALRAQLLTSMAKKKQEEKVQAKKKEEEKKQIVENLKQTVQRIKQKKQPTNDNPSGNLALALERIRSKLVQSNNQDQRKLEEVMRIENTKLQTQVEVVCEPIEPMIELGELDKSKDATLATITDTKNIPLISEGKATKSRLVTSLESVIKPVKKLIITVNQNSDSDFEECELSPKKTVKRVVRRTVLGSEKRETKNAEFESRLDNFLKNIRQQQEELSVNIANTPAASSAVKHLPLSSQKEYEKLVAKMKFLEAEKRKRMRARQLKQRTKSTSQSLTTTSTGPSTTKPSPIKSPTITVANKKPTPEKLKASQNDAVIANTKTSDDKISNTLMKISLLDQEAQQRLMVKTESNYRTHRWVVMNSHIIS